MSSAALSLYRLEILPHSTRKLSARHYQSSTFALQLLEILKRLRILSWSNLDIAPQYLKIHKIAGALTNTVFFVSSSAPHLPTLLVRIYGSSSGSLVSRPRELHTLHVLSSQYNIGPKLYGTFENGRVEEYFDAIPLTPSDLRDKTVSRWVGTRMAELHSVDNDVVVEPTMFQGSDKRCEIEVKQNVESWLPPARDVLSLSTVSDAIRKSFDLDVFEREWDLYLRWLSKFEEAYGASQRVFSHNDSQYGNLLRLRKPSHGTSPHQQIIVVDFEYAGLNPAAFDIANHFHEWTANYHSSTPHILDPSRYPNFEERRNFYRAYLEHSHAHTPSSGESTSNQTFHQLDEQVRVWSPASHAMWAMWGLVQAREDLEGRVTEPEFDYLAYALCRIGGFRREIRQLGIE